MLPSSRTTGIEPVEREPGLQSPSELVSNPSAPNLLAARS